MNSFEKTLIRKKELKNTLEKLEKFETCRNLSPIRTKKEINGEEKEVMLIGCPFPHPTTEKGRLAYLKAFITILTKKGANVWDSHELHMRRNDLFQSALGHCKRTPYNWVLQKEEVRI